MSEVASRPLPPTAASHSARLRISLEAECSSVEWPLRYRGCFQGDPHHEGPIPKGLGVSLPQFRRRFFESLASASSSPGEDQS